MPSSISSSNRNPDFTSPDRQFSCNGWLEPATAIRAQTEKAVHSQVLSPDSPGIIFKAKQQRFFQTPESYVAGGKEFSSNNLPHDPYYSKAPCKQPFPQPALSSPPGSGCRPADSPSDFLRTTPFTPDSSHRSFKTPRSWPEDGSPVGKGAMQYYSAHSEDPFIASNTGRDYSKPPFTQPFPQIGQRSPIESGSYSPERPADPPSDFLRTTPFTPDSSHRSFKTPRSWPEDGSPVGKGAMQYYSARSEDPFIASNTGRDYSNPPFTQPFPQIGQSSPIESSPYSPEKPISPITDFPTITSTLSSTIQSTTSGIPFSNEPALSENIDPCFTASMKTNHGMISAEDLPNDIEDYSSRILAPLNSILEQLSRDSGLSKTQIFRKWSVMETRAQTSWNIYQRYIRDVNNQEEELKRLPTLADGSTPTLETPNAIHSAFKLFKNAKPNFEYFLKSWDQLRILSEPTTPRKREADFKHYARKMDNMVRC